MGYLSDRDRETLRTMFHQMVRPIKLRAFVEEDHLWSTHTDAMLREVSRIAPDLIEYQRFDRHHNAALAALYGVTFSPTIILLNGSGDDSGMRILGVPSGYEFQVLVEDILEISRNAHHLEHSSVTFIRNLQQDLWFDVFVTPT